MLLLAILVLGLSAGAAAQKILKPGRRIDWTSALVQGLTGSLAGGLLASLLSGDGLALRPSGLLGSIIGAIVVIAATNAWQSFRQRA